MGGAITAAVIGAGAAYYSSQQQKQAANQIAKASSGPSTTTSTPWAPSTQYRLDLMARAMNLLGPTGTAPSGGSGGGAAGGGKIVGDTNNDGKLSRRERRALRNGGASGGGGGTGGGAGSTAPNYNQAINDFLNGKYLTNPYLDQSVAAMRAASQKEFAPVDLSAELNGRLGGGAWGLAQAAFATGINNADLNMRFTNWTNQVGNIKDVLGIGTSYDAQLKSIAAQARAAAASNAVARGYLRNATAMLPYQQLGAVQGIVSSLSDPYGTRTTTGPQQAPAYTQDPFSSSIQGGLGGLATYNWGKQQGLWGGTTMPAATVPSGATPSTSTATWGNYVPTLSGF